MKIIQSASRLEYHVSWDNKVEGDVVQWMLRAHRILGSLIIPDLSDITEENTGTTYVSTKVALDQFKKMLGVE